MATSQVSAGGHRAALRRRRLSSRGARPSWMGSVSAEIRVLPLRDAGGSGQDGLGARVARQRSRIPAPVKYGAQTMSCKTW